MCFDPMVSVPSSAVGDGHGERRTARLTDAARTALADRIQELSQGQFSQRGLAAATGLGIGTINDLWAGRSDPSLSTLLALTSALGLHSIEELMGAPGTQAMLRRQGR
jgi:hypothetical protein